MRTEKTKLPLQVNASSGAIQSEQGGKCEMFENTDTGNNMPGTMRRKKGKMQRGWSQQQNYEPYIKAFSFYGKR